MAGWFPRFLLTLSSLILAVGGVMHAAAYGKAVAAITESNLPVFFGSALKAFWLGDSATMILLAAIYGWIAVRPRAAAKSVVVLLAFLPASTAVLLYAFFGAFFAAHMLLAAAVLTFAAGLQFPVFGHEPIVGEPS
ncbi:MAG: hypothetical protein KGL29_12660 [Alphaproteobacteria bacterium]|nr:hypothetical protein [Alphaproteobacteria bacterium]MDE2164044.1 hypothetical protein [Alphaproteobacteria bacterium]MDE2266748.1 hypothetical protein [Alphaproteobacteria bacterium]MDE2499634.1 hypothetical protein [Alphaproteobacteria bacterium]